MGPTGLVTRLYISHAVSKRTYSLQQVTASVSALEVVESPPALEEW